MVQWLRFCASTAKGAGSIPGQETDPTCHVVQLKNLKKQLCLNFYTAELSSSQMSVLIKTLPSSENPSAFSFVFKIKF